MDTHDEDTSHVRPDPRRRASCNHVQQDGQAPAAEKSPSTGFTSLARTYRDVAPYLGLGIQLAATIVVCFFLGRWLDQVLNTAPWLTILGAFTGAAGGLYNFLRTVIRLGMKEKEKQRLEKSARR
jgi:ATP synthase protein I